MMGILVFVISFILTFLSSGCRMSNETGITYDVTLLAVGDNLYHNRVYEKGYNSTTGIYNFDENYIEIKEFLTKYDLKVVNQETVFVDDYSLIDTFPRFGTPKEVGDALVKAGFNVVLGANNHSWDKGLVGVKSTINYWNNFKEVTFTGIYDDKSLADNITVIEKTI